MSGRNFFELLRSNWAEGKFVCVGLDPDIDKIPRCAKCCSLIGSFIAFNSEIVKATRHVVCAYKPNVAFYERHGVEGLYALKQTILYIQGVAPEVPVILDAKRADIGSTNVGYAEAAFDYLGADAITVHPYFGREALEPFLARKDKGVIVLCRTSNPGAREFQDLPVDGRPLYQHVARNVATQWNGNGNCALVVGATYVDELKIVREIVGEMPILIPGVGAQGGDLEKSVRAGKNSRGDGMVINASRSIIYASDDEYFADAALAEVERMNAIIESARA